MEDTSEATSCFSYKVEMVVQILAKDEKTAKEQLDKSGGYVSSRNVTLVDSVTLYTEAKEEDI
jgi:hypothetical protein